ncbi:hypothetical protein FE257_009021 [Aspergillus nanangensis]|uniref:Acyltransferase 3 domain-containing protein n=1 Tax=Aspergillus nanangensis TaxID=2582783 RepID=A0AAD4CYC9_ASPNN|nr:hypothetical protein FE257_009021 [Aspergillus nanangensis]
MIPGPNKNGRQSWLDGLRGIAAVIVAWFHFTVGEMQVPFRLFGEEPAEQNRYFIQLPPFRILFAGQAMVSLFFVISGYSVPIAIIRLRGQKGNAEFYRKITSSVVRRGFRLYMPVLVLCIISHLLFFVGAYHFVFGEGEGCAGAEPWSNGLSHFKCFILSILSTLQLAGPYYTGGLNSQLWTMFVELKGSLAIYLTLLALVSASSRTRAITIACFASVFVFFGMHQFFCFFAGLLFAELDTMSSISPGSTLPTMDIQKSSKTRSRLNQAVILAVFALGTYLLCLPYNDDFPSDYWFPSDIDILPFWEGRSIRIYSWYSIGAVMLVGAIRHLTTIKNLLQTSLCRFLGEISFSLYLLHQTVIRVFRNPILQFVCWKLFGMGFRPTRDDEAGGYVYFLSWAVAAGVIGPVLVVSATFMARVIDRRSIALAYQVEERLLGS